MAPIVSNLSEVWQRTSLVQRVLLLAILMACVVAGALLVSWARKPNMVLLYGRLDPEDAAKIIDKVSERGVAYEVRNNGTSIYVNDAQKDELRMAMSGAGLPSQASKGYSLLDNEKFGASPFTQHVNYVRAVEGELARTVEMIEGVAGARVHVSKPEQTLFAGKGDGPKASVFLKLQTGWRLTAANVAAIVHMVAGGVEGLSPNRVYVSDHLGNLLSGPNDNEFVRGAGSLLDYKAGLEQYLARKAEGMLIAALGPSRASVTVDATIDTTSSSQISETFDPAARGVKKEEITSKQETPPPVAEGATPTTGSSKEETILTEYELTKTTKQETQLPGRVTALTVSAAVDLTPPPVVEGQPAPTLPTLDDCREIIQKALGVTDASSIKVVQMSMYRPVDVPPETSSDMMGMVLEIVRRASIGILVIGALVALKIFRGPKAKGVAVAGVPALGGAGAAAAMLPAGEGEINPDQLRSRISRALQENPDEVKRLFLSWVESEKEGV